MVKRIFIICILVFVAHSAIAQAPKRQYAEQFNTWITYTGTLRFHEKWSAHVEAQWRRNQFLSSPQQLLLRTGLNYHINNSAMITAGYAFVETYPYGEQPVPATFPEHRIWEQLQLKSTVGTTEWVGRFRLEQRYLHFPVATSGGGYEPGDAVYSNRIRLLNRFSIPLNAAEIKDHTVYLSLYDELFVNFGKNVAMNIFDQNRAYAALGYAIPNLGRFEVGYLNQLIFKGDGIRVENNHTLQVGLTSTFDLRKKK